MRSFTIASVAALCLVCGTATAAAQTQVQTIQIGPGGGGGGTVIDGLQLPGQARQNKTGTGRIRGRLVTADTGAPVRRAQVRISGPDILPKTAVSDADGRYEFRELPAGRFSINATKSGFVTMNYGQKRPFEPGKSIDLAEAQVLEKADIVMPRGAAIVGRIADEFGEPIADVMVTAMRSAWANGRRRLQPAGRTAQTNDLGQYRIYGLAPGEYYVSATMRGLPDLEVIRGDTVELTAATTFVNRASPTSAASDPKTGYAPTYFPGTPNGAEAQRIQVAIGQEAPSADFNLLPVRLARVSGAVIGSDGRPVEGAMVQAVPRSGNDAGFAALLGGTARSDRNGQFAVNSVTPGEYTLQVRGMQIFTSSTGGGDTMMFSTRIGGADGQAEYGSVPLSVSGEDVANVMIVTAKGVSVSGRVTFEGGKPANSGSVRISALSFEGDGPAGGFGPGAVGSVTPEGTFEIKGLYGQRLIRANGLPAGWNVKSVTVNGTDVTDAGITIKSNEPVSGVEVTLSSKSTEVSGGVTAGNQPATDYSVVIFSEDAEKWTVPMTRHIAFARPNQQGRYQIKNLPAGSYYAVAVTYIAQGDWNDPEVLARLRSQATRFSLDDGEVKTLDLKLGGE